MYELIQLPEHDYYIDCPTKIGLVKISDGDVVLIDSGNDKDADKTLETLEYIQTLEAARFVSSHAPVTEDIRDLAMLNIHAITGVKEKILELCNAPISFESLLKKVFDIYGLQMNAQQYALIGSTIRSYLSGMYAQKLLTFEFCENQMLWRKVV